MPHDLACSFVLFVGFRVPCCISCGHPFLNHSDAVGCQRPADRFELLFVEVHYGVAVLVVFVAIHGYANLSFTAWFFVMISASFGRFLAGTAR